MPRKAKNPLSQYAPGTLGQPNLVTTDASGAFTLNFIAGPAQMLPAQVTVTQDLAGANVLVGPVTVAPIVCGQTPSGRSTVLAPPRGSCAARFPLRRKR